MYDEQNGDRTHHADGMPPFFVGLEAIREDDMQRVVPDPPRQIERDPMLGEIYLRLFSVPLKKYGYTIFTILYVQKSHASRRVCLARPPCVFEIEQSGCDWGRVMTRPQSRSRARSPLGLQTVE